MKVGDLVYIINDGTPVVMEIKKIRDNYLTACIPNTDMLGLLYNRNEIFTTKQEVLNKLLDLKESVEYSISRYEQEIELETLEHLDCEGKLIKG